MKYVVSSVIVILVFVGLFYLFGIESDKKVEGLCSPGFRYVVQGRYCESIDAYELEKANFLAKIPDIIEACKRKGGNFWNVFETENTVEENLAWLYCDVVSKVASKKELTSYRFKDNVWVKYQFVEYYFYE